MLAHVPNIGLMPSLFHARSAALLLYSAHLCALCGKF